MVLLHSKGFRPAECDRGCLGRRVTGTRHYPGPVPLHAGALRVYADVFANSILMALLLTQHHAMTASLHCIAKAFGAGGSARS